MKVKMSLTAGMLIDQLSAREQARVRRALEQLEQSDWPDLRRHRSIQKLHGELSDQKLFSYRAGEQLRIIFTFQGDVIRILDVVRPDQLRRLIGRTGGDSSE